MGDWIAICGACRAEAIGDLRAGRFSESNLLFPPEFGAGDILYVQDAVAEINGQPVIELDFERDEPMSCMFADRLIPDWVSAVASLTPTDGASLMRRWSARYFAEELREPNWQRYIDGTYGKDLIELCRLARYRDGDVVMVWFL